jgi:hypothetical protein
MECYEQVWTKDGVLWNPTYYCEGCGNEFNKPESELVPKTTQTQVLPK